MTGFGTLEQRDLPFATFCQSLDCSKITINFEYDKCWPLFVYMPTLTGGTITVTCDYEGVVGGPVDITTDIFSSLTLSTVTTVGWSDQLTGSGTSFTTELAAGDYIVVDNYLYRVLSIQSDTVLTLTSMALLSGTTNRFYKINMSYDITPSFFGWTVGAMPNGNYDFTIEYYFPSNGTDTDNTITDTRTILVNCESYCCVYNKLADLADICNGCIDSDNSKAIIEAMFMWALLEAYNGASGCGDSISAEALQERLDRYCDYQPCTNC